jgi:hypothetical protein
MCTDLGVAPSSVESWSDLGGEFSKTDLEKLVRTHRFVRLGPSVENVNKIFQRCFYRILKNRQAISVPVAIKKSQNQMNKALKGLHKMSADEVAKKVKSGEVNSVKVYNSTRKDHVSNTKTKELQVGDHVRLLVKKAKADTFYKSYKNKSFTAQVFKIFKRTKKQPYKYQLKDKGRYYLIDYLLKSAPRDTKSKDLIKGRDILQTKVDKENEEKEEKRLTKEIDENRKRLLKLKEKGDIILPSVERGIKNLNKIKNLQAKSDKIFAYLDELQAEYEREKEKQGVKLKPKKPLKFQVGRKVKDEDYDPADDLLDELENPEPRAKVKRKPRPKKPAVKRVKPKLPAASIPKNPIPKTTNRASEYDIFRARHNWMDREEKLFPVSYPNPRNKAEKKEFAERTAAWNKFEKYMAAAPPRFLKRFQKPKGPQPKIESTRVKQKLVTEFKTQGNIVLRLQKQLKKAQGDKLDRLIRDIETEIQKGQEMTKVLKAKKYKNLKLNLGFFFQ